MAKKKTKRNPWKEARIWRVEVRRTPDSTMWNVSTVVGINAEEAAKKARHLNRRAVSGWLNPSVTKVEQIAYVEA